MYCKLVSNSEVDFQASTPELSYLIGKFERDSSTNTLVTKQSRLFFPCALHLPLLTTLHLLRPRLTRAKINLFKLYSNAYH